MRTILVPAMVVLASCGPPKKGASVTEGWKSEPCDGMEVIAPGETVEGSTVGATSQWGASCGAGARGPEDAWGFVLEEPARVLVELETPEHDGALHLWAGCGEQARAVDCNEDAGGTHRAVVWSHLGPGPYMILADGSGPTDAGPYRLGLHVLADDEPGAPNDTCEGAIAVSLEDGMRATVVDSTFRARDDVDAPCAASPGGPDLFWLVEVTVRSLVTARVIRSDFSSPLVAISEDCTWKDAVCDASAAHILSDPGTLRIMLDSYGADLLGAFEMLIGIQPLAPIEARCAAAPEIVPGQVVEGTTAGEGLFEGRCGNGALGPEDVWILVLDERTSVDATLNSVDFDGVLHVRGRCTDPATETVCNDDHGGEQSSRITTELDAGTWFFFVDGRNKEDQGSYEFDITTGP